MRRRIRTQAVAHCEKIRAGAQPRTVDGRPGLEGELNDRGTIREEPLNQLDVEDPAGPKRLGDRLANQRAGPKDLGPTLCIVDTRTQVRGRRPRKHASHEVAQLAAVDVATQQTGARTEDGVGVDLKPMIDQVSDLPERGGQVGVPVPDPVGFRGRLTICERLERTQQPLPNRLRLASIVGEVQYAGLRPVSGGESVEQRLRVVGRTIVDKDELEPRLSGDGTRKRRQVQTRCLVIGGDYYELSRSHVFLGFCGEFRRPVAVTSASRPGGSWRRSTRREAVAMEWTRPAPAPVGSPRR